MALTLNLIKNGCDGAKGQFGVVVLVWFLSFAMGCAAPSSSFDSEGPQKAGISAEAFARSVVELVAERGMIALAEATEPSRGLTFSPYGYVDLENSVTLRPEELVDAWKQDKVFTWGHYDGSGEVIELSLNDYFDRFVYDQAFLLAPQVAVDRVIGRGNTLVNHAEVFPDATVVEFYMPGKSPRFGGLDWASLRVVLIPKTDGWWLRALVHDQWTI